MFKRRIKLASKKGKQSVYLCIYQMIIRCLNKEVQSND